MEEGAPDPPMMTGSNSSAPSEAIPFAIVVRTQGIVGGAAWKEALLIPTKVKMMNCEECDAKTLCPSAV